MPLLWIIYMLRGWWWYASKKDGEQERTEMRIPWNMEKKKDEFELTVRKRMTMNWLFCLEGKSSWVFPFLRLLVFGLHAMLTKSSSLKKNFSFLLLFSATAVLVHYMLIMMARQTEEKWIRLYYIGYLFSVEQFPFFSSSPIIGKRNRAV